MIINATDFCAVALNMLETWWNFAAIFGKLQQLSHSNRTEIAMKSPLVYMCDESYIKEGDKNRIKNRMCKRAFPEEMNSMTQKNGQGENEDSNGIQVFFEAGRVQW